MTVKGIINIWLQMYGYDGLYRDGDECAGCRLDNLMPCGLDSDQTLCHPGYYHPSSDGNDFWIGEDKNEDDD